MVPIKSDSEHYPLDGKLRVYRSRTGGNEWEALTKGLPQSDCYVNVLRDAMAVDSLEHAASISAPRAARCTRRPMPATTGRPSSAIFRRCFRSRSRRCHDPRGAAGTSAHAGAHRRRSEVRGGGAGHTADGARRARGSVIPMLRGTIRDHVTQQRRALRSLLCLRGGSVARLARHAAAGGGRDGRGAVCCYWRDRRRVILTGAAVSRLRRARLRAARSNACAAPGPRP